MRQHWISIPGGRVTLQEGGYLAAPTTFEVAPFAISRYPVTNSDYAAFVAADGYTNPTWWTDEGWRLRQKEHWTEPRHWGSRDWNRPDCPVVGVSWYEALAYCAWLGQQTGQTISLPTEQQWQRAAQGDDAREFPWGNSDPAPHLCNWNRLVDETTPVTCYPLGASPFGVMDMSGNVWEWCLNRWDNGTTHPDASAARALRGGSWSSDSPFSLAANHRSVRDPNTQLAPSYRHHVTVGLRCVIL